MLNERFFSGTGGNYQAQHIEDLTQVLMFY